MMVDETAALSDVLREYQQDSASDHAEARLAIALTRVVEKRVRPSLAKKLRPQDVDDVCSEIILGFWKFRHSVRPEEVGQLISTLEQRKRADQLRGYYKDAERRTAEPSAEPREGDPGTALAEDTWDVLSGLELNAKDHLVSWLVAEGVEKQVIAEVLGIDATTISRSLKRVRKLLKNGSQATANHPED
jgi:DNA-directed RNA polymerase specialized sigma24 family protein